MKFSLVPTFPAVAHMSWPDESKPGVVRKFAFDCRFKAVSNDPAAREELERKQNEEGGVYGLLEQVLVSVKLPDTIEPVDEDDQPMEALDWVKRNAIAGSAAAVAFWDVINRDVEAKNSKRSRGR
jgi:hypothetical protein